MGKKQILNEWGEAKFKCSTNVVGGVVVTLLSFSLSIAEQHYLWFWVVSGEQPSAQELNLSKPFLIWKSHEFWLLTRLLLPTGSSELKIFLEKEIFQHLLLVSSAEARAFRGRLNRIKRAEAFDLEQNVFNSNTCHFWEKKCNGILIQLFGKLYVLWLYKTTS